MTHTIETLAAAIIRQRRLLLGVFIVITIALAGSAARLRIDAGFDKLVPLQHPFMKTFTAYRDSFGGANRILLGLIRRDGDIFEAGFLAKLKQATDDVFFLPGVDRTSVKSLFTPNARFIEIVEAGFSGGDIVPATYAGTATEIARIRNNVLKSGEVGRLVTNDLRGALISAQLLDTDPATGLRLDYFAVARQLEQIRARYADDGVDVHIIGFAKAVGDIGEGARGVLAFFALAFAITALLLLGYTRSPKLTGLVLAVALLPVIWLLGLLPLLGYGIDPMSVLVPFLIFSIGVSHAVQMAHAWNIDYRAGGDPAAAAAAAFRKLFIPGALALLANALGFLVIMLIRIDIVRELGITASLGVALMIATNKILLPVLLSWTRVARTPVPAATDVRRPWSTLAALARPGPAAIALAATAALAATGAWQAQRLQIGDLGQGLPELRADSRYNRDHAAITGRFAIGVDVFSVIVQTRDLEAACMDYQVMTAIDRFGQRMRETPGVQSVLALPDIAKHLNQATHEGNPKWRALPRDPQSLAEITGVVHSNSGLLDAACNIMQILVFTEDHQSPTLSRIVAAAQAAALAENGAKVEFLLAGGNVGVMAATNEAVAAAENQILAALFASIALLCFAVFRSWRATLCILAPLALASVLCNALMATLGIGLKVSTLPVIALGVGVGVDYGIYLYGALRGRLAAGLSLPAAFADALRLRGGAIAFTAATMSIGVASWGFSALKFQADMGILLAFMFLINMVGALILLPALAAWILDARRAPAATGRAGDEA